MNRRRPEFRKGVAFVLCILRWNALAAKPPEGIPAGAADSIRAVNVAAGNRDFIALRKLMVEDFVWSFGGDASSQQAIDAWGADPAYLVALRTATAAPCERVGEHIQCPAGAGISSRAGFTLTPAGWRLVYFVSGD